MAVAQLSISVQSRKTTSATAHAAYISCSRLERPGGLVDNYERKRGLAYESCQHFTGQPLNRQTFWQEVESREKRKDSTVSRELTFSLPCELSLQQNIKLSEDFRVKIVDLLELEGSDLCIHYPPAETRNRGAGGHENPHGHMLIPDRDAYGEKLSKKLYAKPEMVIKIRHIWEITCNEHLEAAGRPERICMRRYEDQLADVRAEIAALEAQKAALLEQIQNEQPAEPKPEITPGSPIHATDRGTTIGREIIKTENNYTGKTDKRITGRKLSSNDKNRPIDKNSGKIQHGQHGSKTKSRTDISFPKNRCTGKRNEPNMEGSISARRYRELTKKLDKLEFEFTSALRRERELLTALELDKIWEEKNAAVARERAREAEQRNKHQSQESQRARGFNPRP